MLLAESAACPVQAFRVGRNVYATQFHPELDLVGIRTRIDVYRHAGYFEPDQADVLHGARRRGRGHPPGGPAAQLRGRRTPLSPGPESGQRSVALGLT